jgi:hypothetical protein
MDAESLDQPITEARANISDLVAATQLLRRVYFLTRRDTRKAALIPAELGELIVQVGGVEKAAEILRSAS